MRNIRKFETFDDFLAAQEAVSGSGEYVQDIMPGFAYVKERFIEGGGKYAFYNGSDSGETGDTGYVFGDVIYYNGSEELQKVYWSGWTEELGVPIGFVVIPTSMAPDGNARMIALTNLESNDPPEVMGSVEKGILKSTTPGAQSIYTYNGYNLVGDLNWYDAYIANFPGDTETIYDVVQASNEGVMSTDFSGVTENPVADGEYYTSLNYSPVVSPYMRDSDGINPNYLQEVWEVQPGPEPKSAGNTTDAYNALSDFSGLTWTKLLAESQEMAYENVQGFSTSGTNAGDWYIPSLGEAGFIQARLRAIGMIFNEIFGESETYNAYISTGVNFTSTLAYVSSNPAPFLYYFTESAAEVAEAVAATRELALGTNYPSDVPGPVIGGFCSVGLTYYSDGGIKSAKPEEKKKAETETKGGDILLGASVSTNSGYVRPMAMIKEGHIVTEVGIPVANGHQVSDISNGGGSVVDK